MAFPGGNWRHTSRQRLVSGLTFDHLFTFQTLARAGSFRAAAAELALTQPAVSQRIRHLERLLGCTLLERRQGSRSELTAAGREFLAFAEEVLTRTDLFHQRLEQMKDLPENSTLTVVSDSDHIKHLLVEAVMAMKETAPSVRVVIKHEPSRQACTQALSEGRADLGICRYPAPSEFPALGTIEERMYLYARPEDRIHALPQIDRIAHLAHTDFATFADGMRSRELVERWAEKVGASLHVVLESRGLEAMRTYVTRGLALAVLPEFCVREDLRAGLLRVVTAPGLPLLRGAVILAPPERAVAQAARVFLGLLPAKVESSLSPSPRAAAPVPA
ncbi:LysR family transcriptional regulator [Streptomyces sp. TRM68416]|uniref:LysR family transcriptional regulator n=1 Tax=Streptomyces sp. TRM68416 TaxID=2758412 RepID=UPI0016621AA5|nr:LysR family transcriptional regulator [Streptomyces sp. TRM68416]MBD0843962.1 LysR family transcriptional regulator [Streptomyces sp. TRM68416]